ncbi:MAG: PilZ domain-containing protein [Polyangiaceae bacterium]
MHERRSSPRQPFDVFVNKFIRGYPHACRAIDVSAGGMELECLGQPDSYMPSFSLELRLPGDPHTVWLWARRVARVGRRERYEFLHASAEDRHRLARYLAS